MKNLGLIGIVATAAVAAIGALACGTDTPSSITCSADADCRVGEICHPDAKVCVQTCETGDDCPDASKNCAAIDATSGGDADGGTGTGTKICKCVTDQLCAGGPAGADSVCSTSFSVCTPKCAADLDCPSGSTCDTTTGQCQPESAATCDPACGQNETCVDGTCVAGCTWDTDCGAGQICDLSTAQCGAAPSCNASNQQPDSCIYGQFCSGSSCAFVVGNNGASCANFSGANASAGATAALNWAPLTGTGPVIYSVERISQDTGWDCGNANQSSMRVEVKAYQPPGGTFPAGDATAVQGFFYVQVNGSEKDATPLMRPSSGYTRSSDGTHATFKLNFCFPTSQNNLQLGLYFTNGNAVCRDIARQ